MAHALRAALFAMMMAYAFMLGTVYPVRGGEPYQRCAKLEDTNFNAFLAGYGHDR